MGRALTEEVELARREKIRRTNLGKHPTEETKQKLREANARQFTPEARARHSERIKELWTDPSYRSKTSKAHEGYVLSDEHKAKLVALHKGRKRSPETRQRVREARLREWATRSLDERRRLNRSLVGRPSSLELAVKAVLDAVGIDYLHGQYFGRYIPDFRLRDQKVIIECDGEYWHSRPGQVELDAKKDTYYESFGYRVVRLSEHEIRLDVAKAVLTQVA